MPSNPRFEQMPDSLMDESAQPGHPIVYTDTDGIPVSIDLPISIDLPVSLDLPQPSASIPATVAVSPVTDTDCVKNNTIEIAEVESPAAFTQEFLVDDQIINVVPAEEMIVSSSATDVNAQGELYCVLGSKQHIIALKRKVEELEESARRLQAERESAQRRAESVDANLANYRQEMNALDRSSTVTSTAFSTESAKRQHHTEHTFGPIQDIAILDDVEAERERLRHVKKTRYLAENSDWDPDNIDCRRFPIDLPRARQYLYRGVLYREEAERKTTWTELLWDLVFVGVVAVLAHRVGSDPTPAHIGEFILLFALVWRIWYDMHYWVNITASEDFLHRTYLHIEMILVTGLAVCCDSAFESSGRAFAVFYLISRLIRIVMFALLGSNDRRFIFQTTMQIGGMAISSLVMLGSLFVAEGDYRRIILWIIVVLIDGSYVGITIHLIRSLRWRRVFPPIDYLIAMNIEHMSERMGLFVIIVLGEAVAASIYTNVGPSIDVRFLKAAFGILLAFSLHWIYFLVDGGRQYIHAVRRSIITAQLWAAIHLPLTAALGACGGAMGTLIELGGGGSGTAHAAASPSKSSANDPRMVWLFCVGAAIGLFCFAFIGVLHKAVNDEEGNDMPRFSKWVRLSARAILATVWCVVPVIPGLNTDVGCIVFLGSTAYLLVLFEKYGQLKKITEEDRKRHREYVKRCRRLMAERRKERRNNVKALMSKPDRGKRVADANTATEELAVQSAESTLEEPALRHRAKEVRKEEEHTCALN